MSVISDFKSRFGEFSTADVDAYLPDLIDEYPCYYGGDYSVACDKTAILYLLAHLLVGEIAVQTDSSPDKIVTGQTARGVSLTFAGGSFSGQNAFFATTKYGRRYLNLIAKNGGGYFV